MRFKAKWAVMVFLSAVEYEVISSSKTKTFLNENYSFYWFNSFQNHIFTITVPFVNRPWSIRWAVSPLSLTTDWLVPGTTRFDEVKPKPPGGAEGNESVKRHRPPVVSLLIEADCICGSILKLFSFLSSAFLEIIDLAFLFSHYYLNFSPAFWLADSF